MKETKYKRKMDSAGRILVPIRLREELGIEVEVPYTFYTHSEGKDLYLCIKIDSESAEKKIREAKELLGIED